MAAAQMHTHTPLLSSSSWREPCAQHRSTPILGKTNIVARILNTDSAKPQSTPCAVGGGLLARLCVYACVCECVRTVVFVCEFNPKVHKINLAPKCNPMRESTHPHTHTCDFMEALAAAAPSPPHSYATANNPAAVFVCALHFPRCIIYKHTMRHTVLWVETHIKL